MFEYKSGGYSRRLQWAFVAIAVSVALVLGIGPGIAGMIKNHPPLNPSH